MTELTLAPQWQLYLFSGLGTLILWIKMSRENKRIHGLGDIVETIISSERSQYLGTFVLFLAIGTFVGVFVVAPHTQVQAFAAGMAWSRLAAKD